MINQDFFAALELLEREKGISQDEFIAALGDAIGVANKKNGEMGEISIKLDYDKKSINIYSVRHVVEEVTDHEKEISLEDAKLSKKSLSVGDDLVTEVKSKDFGRIAAQTAKQIITQKLREIEFAKTVTAFEDKAGELMSCTVRRIENGSVYVELSDGQAEGVMPPFEQVASEKYYLGQRLDVFVKRISNNGRSSKILVSRAANGLLGKLFELVVPEIQQGIVEIKSIAREAGQRSKIAIYSNDPLVDAVGACVGNKGARVNAVCTEIGDEKVDIIPWSEDALAFIAKSLAPATVTKIVQTGEKTALAYVPEDKLSLAIGRNGINARLAVRLTGWKIDVKSDVSAFEDGYENVVDNEQPADSEE